MPQFAQTPDAMPPSSANIKGARVCGVTLSLFLLLSALPAVFLGCTAASPTVPLPSLRRTSIRSRADLSPHPAGAQWGHGAQSVPTQRRHHIPAATHHPALPQLDAELCQPITLLELSRWETAVDPVKIAAATVEVLMNHFGPTGPQPQTSSAPIRLDLAASLPWTPHQASCLELAAILDFDQDGKH